MKKHRHAVLAGILALLAVAVQAAPRRAGAGQPIEGANVYGRTGLLFTDTARVVGDGKGLGAAHLLIVADDDYDAFQLPFGGAFGIQDVEIYGNAEFATIDPDGGDDASGLGTITAGGRWKLPIEGRNMPDFAAALEISHGPLEEDLAPKGTDINIKGMVTHDIPAQRLLLNGGLGILRVGKRDFERTVSTPFGDITIEGETDSETVIQINGGLGYAFTPRITGILELAINEFGEDAGALSLGVRGRSRGGLGFQGLLSLGIDEGPDMVLGGGVFMGFGGR